MRKNPPSPLNRFISGLRHLLHCGIFYCEFLMKINLFEFAPQELSQEALLLWLLRYSDSRCQEDDVSLHQGEQNYVGLHNED